VRENDLTKGGKLQRGASTVNFVDLVGHLVKGSPAGTEILCLWKKQPTGKELKGGSKTFTSNYGGKLTEEKSRKKERG